MRDAASCDTQQTSGGKARPSWGGGFNDLLYSVGLIHKNRRLLETIDAKASPGWKPYLLLTNTASARQQEKRAMTTDDDDMENGSGAYFVLRDALGDEQRRLHARCQDW